MLTRLATPTPSQRPTRRTPACAAAAARPRTRRGPRSSVDPAGAPGARSTASSPISVSQQPRRPQRHSRPAPGFDAHVPDLAGVPAGAAERAAADDDAAADADLAGQVDHVGRVRGHPAQVLGHRAEVALVADRDRQRAAQLGAEQQPERHVHPAEVGREPDQLAGDRRPSPAPPTPMPTGVGAARREQRLDQRPDPVQHLRAPRSRRATGAALPAVEHHAAEPDPRRRQVLDADVDGERPDVPRTAARPGSTAGRRRPGRPAPPRGRGRRRPARWSAPGPCCGSAR